MEIEIFSYTILVPAIITGSVAFLAFRLERIWKFLRACIVPAAISAGYIAGHVGILGAPALMPGELTKWLFYIAIAIPVYIGIDSVFLPRGIASSIGRVLFSGGVFAVIALPVIEYRWSFIEGAFHFVAFILYLQVMERSLDSISSRLKPFHFFLFIIPFFILVSGCIVAANSAVIAQLQGVLTAVTGAFYVALMLFSSGGRQTGGLFYTISFLCSLHITGAVLFAYMVPLYSVLILLSPVLFVAALWISERKAIRFAGFTISLALPAVAAYLQYTAS